MIQPLTKQDLNLVQVLLFVHQKTLQNNVCSVEYIVSRLGSLMENWEALGLPFPDAMKPYINQMRKSQEDKIKKYLNKKEVE